MERNGVVVVGSHVQGLFMKVTRFPGPDETVQGWDFEEAVDGGKGSHQAIACGRLGLETQFVGCVGADRLGDTAAGWLSDSGVGLAHLKRSRQVATGCGFVMIDPDGIPAMTSALGANGDLLPADIDRAAPAFEMAKIVLITLEIPLSIALYAAKIARRCGAFTVLTPGPAEAVPAGGFDDLDLIVPNENEAQTLLGEPHSPSDPAELAHRLMDFYKLERVVVTLGANGAYVLEDGAGLHLPAMKVKPVHTGGAGDCFTGALAFGLHQGASMADAARFGVLCAGRAVGLPGTFPSFGRLEEVAEFFQRHGWEVPASLRPSLFGGQ
jgi:ribokinase